MVEILLAFLKKLVTVEFAAIGEMGCSGFYVFYSDFVLVYIRLIHNAMIFELFLTCGTYGVLADD